MGNDCWYYRAQYAGMTKVCMRKSIVIAQMTLTGMQLILPIDPSGPVRISDEKIGDEPNCWWKLAGTLEPDLWIWNPDLLRGDNLIPIYRLQGARP